SGALSLCSVVLDQLSLTFTLLHSLLMVVITTHPHSGDSIENVLSEVRSPLLRYCPKTCGEVKQLVSVLLQCCGLPNASTTAVTVARHQVEVLEDEGGCVEGGEQTAADTPAETDGYEADTEYLMNNNTAQSARDSGSEDQLQCPELVLLALDLIINHHERFLESKEEDNNAMTSDTIHTGPIVETRAQPRENNEKDFMDCGDEIMPSSDKLRSRSSSSVSSASSSVYHSMSSDTDDDGGGDDKQETALKSDKFSVKVESEKRNKKKKIQSSKFLSERNYPKESKCSENVIDSCSAVKYNKIKSEKSISAVESLECELSDKEDSNSMTSPEHKTSTPIGVGIIPYLSGPSSQCCGSEAAHSASLTQCVHALLLLSRSSANVCQRLHALGFLGRLLDGFAPIINSNQPCYQGMI
ncbi:unnamed protein product, partial [Meganyctiphanes norvegica]